MVTALPQDLIPDLIPVNDHFETYEVLPQPVRSGNAIYAPRCAFKIEYLHWPYTFAGLYAVHVGEKNGTTVCGPYATWQDLAEEARKYWNNLARQHQDCVTDLASLTDDDPENKKPKLERQKERLEALFEIAN